MKFRTLFHVALVSVATLGLAGCETMNQAANDTGDWFGRNNPFKSSGEETTAVTTQTAAACPPVMAAEELKTLSQFSEEHSPRAENNISTITIANVASTCKYTDKNIAVDLDITFDGALGPKSRVWNGGRPSFAYPYFVAITQADGRIVTKEVFGVTLSYDRNKSVATQHEHMRQVIPLQGPGSVPQQLVVGFQLTEAQLAYNRSLDGRQGMAVDVVPASGSTPIVEKAVEKKPVKKVVKKKKKKAAPKPVVKEEKPVEAPAAEAAPAEMPAAEAPAAEAPAPAAAPEVEAAPPALPLAVEPAPAPSETPPATDASPATPPEAPAAQ
jgi:hypothetical protein